MMALQRWQAAKVKDSLRPSLHYLTRLRERMEQTGRHQGKLYHLVCKARMAVFDLCVELHYLSCDGGVWRLPEEE
jgi:hypothetical protein